MLFLFVLNIVLAIVVEWDDIKLMIKKLKDKISEKKDKDLDSFVLNDSQYESVYSGKSIKGKSP